MTEDKKVWIAIQLVGLVALFSLVIHYWYKEIYKNKK